MKRKAFWKKTIPLAIIFLFIVVAFSPLHVNSNGTSSVHENSVKCNPQLDSLSNNSPFSHAGHVLYTLVFSNNSLLKGNVVNTSNGLSPIALAYDPVNQYMYVPDPTSCIVTAINSTTDKFVYNITVGIGPDNVAYDPSNTYIYVTNACSNNLSVINSTTDRVIHNITVGSRPGGIAYDPSNKYMYVAIFGSDNVTVINSTTNTIVHNITVGVNPSGVAYDPSNKYMYVTKDCSDNVTVINSTTNTIVHNITVGVNPSGVAYDPSNKYMYVINFLSDTISVINSTTDRVIHNITVGSRPGGIAYDPSNKYIYVANTHSNNVTVINGTTCTIVKNIVVGLCPRGIAYDPANKYMYVANTNSGSLSIIGNTYKATFTESGLPYKTKWAVNLTNSTGASIKSGQITENSYSFNLTNGTYSYTLQTANKVYEPFMPSGSFTVNGYSITEPVTFLKVIYKTTFTETGLPSATTWYVNGTNIKSGSITGTSYSFNLTNGTYTYTVQTANKVYGLYKLSGSFTVNGAPIKETVKFSKEYYATFKEKGLPNGTTWYVNGTYVHGYNNSPGNIIIPATNGTYAFTISNLSSYYTTTPHLIVTINGTNVTETIHYYHWAYITGTISPGNATLTINGNTVPVSSSGHFNVSVANGTYCVIASENGHQVYHKNVTLNTGGVKNLTISLKHASKPSSIFSTEIYVIIVIIAIIAVIVSMIITMKRKKQQ